MQHDVSAFSDLSETGLHEVEAGGLKILLARDGDTVLATGATCTHKGAPLKNGTRIGNRVICPWHHACFDLEDGDHIEPPGQGCLSRFETSVVDGRVLVDLPEGAKRTPARGRAERPQVRRRPDLRHRRRWCRQPRLRAGAGAPGL